MRAAVLLCLVAAPLAAQNATPIGTIDYYGLRHVPDSAVRRAVGLAVGGVLPDSSGPILRRLEAIPGVAEARIAAFCCAAGSGVMVYVGIREDGVPAATYRAAPNGAVRLPDTVLAAQAEFEHAMEAAVAAHDFAEDDSRGYALFHFPAARAVQERFPGFAARYRPELSDVLRHSADSAQREFAAAVIAYAPDKRAVIPDLVYALDDPASQVRNDAARALWVMGSYGVAHPEAGLDIPATPFIAMLHSVDWTDRNKGSNALMALTAGRDSGLLARLEAEALPELEEMAKWNNFGHAGGALMILGRIEGLPDSTLLRAFAAGQRDVVLQHLPIKP